MLHITQKEAFTTLQRAADAAALIPFNPTSHGRLRLARHYYSLGEYGDSRRWAINSLSHSVAIYDHLNGDYT